MGLTLATSVEGFFQEIVTESVALQGLKATETTQFYLVGLLAEFCHARITDEPLSILYMEAQQCASASEQVRTLKEIGDTTLYVTGFFSDSLDQSVMPLDFYESLGQAAYGSLAGRLNGSGVAPVYRELSSKFKDFVQVLQTVRTKVHLADEITEIYRRFVRSGKLVKA